MRLSLLFLVVLVSISSWGSPRRKGSSIECGGSLDPRTLRQVDQYVSYHGLGPMTPSDTADLIQLTKELLNLHPEMEAILLRRLFGNNIEIDENQRVRLLEKKETLILRLKALQKELQQYSRRLIVVEDSKNGTLTGFTILEDGSVVGWGKDGFVIHWVWTDGVLSYNSTFDKAHLGGFIKGVYQIHDGSLVIRGVDFEPSLTHWIWNGSEYIFNQILDSTHMITQLDYLQKEGSLISHPFLNWKGVTMPSDDFLLAWDSQGFSIWEYTNQRFSSSSRIDGLDFFGTSFEEMIVNAIGPNHEIYVEVKLDGQLQSDKGIDYVLKFTRPESLEIKIRQLQEEIEGIDRQIESWGSPRTKGER